jgi:hypothetical protein
LLSRTAETLRQAGHRCRGSSRANIANTSRSCGRSVDGGVSFSDPVRIDKPGQFADNPNRQDILPSKNARLAISPSLAYDATRDRLLWVYQNNLHRGISGADISLQTSDDFGATWSDARTISLAETGAPAPRDQFFPWLSVDESGNAHAIWYDTRNDPAYRVIETFQALSWLGTQASRSSHAGASSATITRSRHPTT